MGRLPDPAYIGAVTMGAAMFSAVYWLFGFLRMGTTGLAAQSYGRADLQEVLAIGLRAGCIAIALGTLIVLLQWPLSTLLFSLFEPGNQVGALARTYYDIRIFGAPGLLVYLVALGILFGLQRMRDTLWLSIGFNLTNLGLDVLFVLGFDWGVAGVAAGTVISEWGAAALGWLLVFRALNALGWQRQPAGNLWLRTKVLALFSVSGNLIIRTFFVQLPFFVGTVIATQMGETLLAAHGVLMQLFFLMTYSLDGFAHTAESLTGFTYGARNRDALKQAVYYSGFWGVVLAVVTALSFFTFGEMFIAGLTIATEVRQAAGEYLPWVAVAPLMCVWAFLFDGIFIGATRITEMRNAMFAAAVVWAVVLYLTIDHWHYHAVWFAMNAFMLIRSGLLYLYYPRIERGASEVYEQT